MKKLIAFAVVFFVSSSLYAQQARQMISYQGVIQGTTGAPVRDSIYPIAVSFWTDPTGGTRLWQDVFQTPVTGGVFNIQLGSGNPLPSPQDMDRPLWISVSFNGGEEALPRSPLSAVPTALNVADSSITTAKLADRSVTWNKMGTEYVPYIRVNGAKITTGQNSINFTGGDGLKVDYDSNSMSVIIHPDSGGETTGKGGNIKPMFIAHNPCGTNSDGTGADSDYNTVSGGCDNHATASFGYSTVGGGQGNKAQEDWATVGGGLSNTAGNGGASQQHQTVGGGSGNYAVGDDAVIAGGEDDTATGDHAEVAGGYENNSSGTGASIGGGEHNAALGHHSTIMGGEYNTATDSFSSVLGGRNLTLGKYSVGFNASSTVTNLTSASDTNVAYLGNVDLWLGNVDNTARALRFYSPNTDTTYSYPAQYSSFQAGRQTTSIPYLLPTTPPSTGQVLALSSYSSPYYKLAWVSGAGASGWLLTGNAGTSDTINYLGTQDSQAFEIRVHNNTLDTTGGNQRVMRYSEGPTSPNILGGSSYDSLTPGLSGAAILSGGSKLAPNVVSDTFSVIGGGQGNLIQGPLSVIAGGENNQITSAGADHNFIGGGLGNVEANPSFGVIGGGLDNYLGYDAWSSAIGSGDSNTVQTALSFIGSGWYNKITGSGPPYGAVIVGGGYNLIATSAYSFIGGGLSETVSSPYAVLGGGLGNKINANSDYSVLVGGGDNYITNGRESFLGGGGSDTILSSNAFLGGGGLNKVDTSSNYAFLGAGIYNSIRSAGSSVLAGGQANSIIDADHSFLGAGFFNKIENQANSSVIGGGASNVVSSLSSGVTIHYGVAAYDQWLWPGESAILGGGNDTINGAIDVIGGGNNNLIDTNSSLSTISGGQSNSITQGFGTIGGGYANHINMTGGTIGGGYMNQVTGEGAAIPGGVGLNAQGYAQFVTGRFNVPQGTTNDIITTNDDFLAIFGNGTDTSIAYRSDAFEISINGHSIVHHNLGNLIDLGTTPIWGGTYQDNGIIAWGNIPSDFGNASPGPPIRAIPPASYTDLGVLQVLHPHGGEYVICLSTRKSDGITPITFTDGSVTASLRDDDMNIADSAANCGTITVTKLGVTFPGQLPNTTCFIVRTTLTSEVPCNPEDRPFFFKVCARP